MQTDVSKSVLSDSQAAQFALKMLNDLVLCDARSSVWNAQVELLSDFVNKDVGQPASPQLDSVSRQLLERRAQPRPPRPLPGTLFVPMS